MFRSKASPVLLKASSHISHTTSSACCRDMSYIASPSLFQREKMMSPPLSPFISSRGIHSSQRMAIPMIRSCQQRRLRKRYLEILTVCELMRKRYLEILSVCELILPILVESHEQLGGYRWGWQSKEGQFVRCHTVDRGMSPTYGLT